jgi:hypothetical protein
MLIGQWKRMEGCDRLTATGAQLKRRLYGCSAYARNLSRPRDARLTRERAREVCQRTGSSASIEGSIASLGSRYVLGLKAVNCRNGDLLAEEQVAANGKEQVLKALGRPRRRSAKSWGSR